VRFRRRRDLDDTLSQLQIRVTVREGPPPPVLPEPLFWRTDLADAEWAPPAPRVVLEGVIFERVRLEGLRLGLFAVSGSTLRDCTLTGLVADEGTLGAWRLGRSYYTDCRFEECDLSWIEAGWARFSGCVFAGCRIKGWFARDASFIGCSFPGTSLLETTFFGKGTGHGRRDAPNGSATTTSPARISSGRASSAASTCARRPGRTTGRS
jgi:hypothetical protein